MLRSMILSRVVLFLGIVSIFGRAGDDKTMNTSQVPITLTALNKPSPSTIISLQRVKRANVDSFYAKSYRGDNVCTWVGPSTGSWENAGNWSCGHIPTSDNDVEIFTGTVTINTAAFANSVIVGGGAGLIVASGQSITILH